MRRFAIVYNCLRYLRMALVKLHHHRSILQN